MSHTCHAINCTVHIAPSLLMCKRHWTMVPRRLQLAVRKHYRPGQEIDKRVSSDYLNAAKAAVDAVAAYENSLQRQTSHEHPQGIRGSYLRIEQSRKR